MVGSLCAQMMQMLVLMVNAFTPFCRRLEDASQAQDFPKHALLPVVALVEIATLACPKLKNIKLELSACSCGGWLLAQSGTPAV